VTPLSFHIQSRPCRRKGTHPTPLSTETSFRSGKRWQMPPPITDATARALPMKISAQAEA